MSTYSSNGTLTHKSGTLRYTLHQTASETLLKGGIQAAVVCPDGVDPNEWIAVHTIDFYNDIIMIYNSVKEECTVYSCPVMSAGKVYEFLWTDKYKYRKPTRLPAHTYIEYLVSWVLGLLQDDSLFPTEPNVPFPRDYLDKVKNIFRRILRVYEHIYYSHISLLRHLSLLDQFQFSLCHFIFFADQFDLVTSQNFRPLQDFLNQFAPNLRCFWNSKNPHF
ncbi:uncharacterized protein [Blastocystis hominis]|uniref:Mob1/phocein n=1 Tax=Blastocystis hominis TaxID=12968 RepID=D8M7R3_BLAHO|nr:uncharacterized protein [Blastocystis hominis]CBK24102.2 unnamed protein product [Blastocystis hominis]|eukprot:XP_012898150.1 uncharacterized protein [Blastocystis hominis]